VPLPPLAEIAADGITELNFPPRLGEHNESIYGQALGLDPKEVATLKERGII
jgi:crotonobetainyl-CoA:carnitine CoA-transferase CaiB-like acyl-CoA transferase